MTGAPPDDDSLNIDMLSKWLSQSVLLPVVVRKVFKALLAGTDERLMPDLKDRTVLSPSALVAISSQLPAEIRYEWALLFSR